MTWGVKWESEWRPVRVYDQGIADRLLKSYEWRVQHPICEVCHRFARRDVMRCKRHL